MAKAGRSSGPKGLKRSRLEPPQGSQMAASLPGSPKCEKNLPDRFLNARAEDQGSRDLWRRFTFQRDYYFPQADFWPGTTSGLTVTRQPCLALIQAQWATLQDTLGLSGDLPEHGLQQKV